MAQIGFPVESGLVVVASGFDADFEARFAELYAVAKRPARRILINSADAEDVAAETLARLYLHWSKVSGRDGLHGWVLRVAANLAIDQFRRGHRPVGKVMTVSPDEIDAIDRRVTIADAVCRLPRRQREVIALRYFADLSDAQIAATLSMAVPTVRTHLHRARQALAVSLGTDQGGLDDLA